MALYKDYAITLDTKRSPKVTLQNIVAGETGNRITVTFTNDDVPVELASSTHRVCLKVDASSIGTRRQDSSEENSGISFADGKAVILLSKDSYGEGLNRACLEVYSTATETNDTLICSADFIFPAKANPTGENAGSVYPSLITLENELNTLKTETNTAKTNANNAASAANDAASSATSAASNANDKATAANNAATSATNAASSANSAASSATSAASSANSAASSANSAASAANAAAAAASVIVATVPSSASESSGVITFKNSSGTTLFTVSLPLYAGGVE